ncbi:MAG: enoyl-CoA hydratase [Alphaproteobacteria bacterium]
MAMQKAELSNAAGAVLLRSDQGGITTLTLNRPNSGNSLSHELVDALQAAWDDIDGDASVRVVVLAASGRLFCTGHDLNESIDAMNDPPVKLAANRSCSRMMQSMLKLSKPIIAKVHGVATAAGCQLMATCDLAVASTEARFATPGVNIGLWCLSPQVALSRTIAPKHAMQMLLTGKLQDAETALRFGLINEVVVPDQLDERVNELAAEIASKSPHSLAMGKRSFYRQLTMPLDEAYEYVDEVIVRAIQSTDAKEGISAFLEKRKPKWTGS